MPIFEFKCTDCNEYVELLVMNKKDEVELVCPKCGSENLERILSTTNHTVTGGSHGRPADSGPSTKTRTCSSGSCTTYTVPGPA